jgi:hypothetical protein
VDHETHQPNWRIAYPAFLLGMAAIGTFNYWLLKWAEARQAAKLLPSPGASVHGAGEKPPPDPKGAGLRR